jgi:hypothetical protein
MILDIPGVADRRHTPRYEINLSVEMLLENGNILDVTTRNISSHGLQVICDNWVTDKIDPRGIQTHSFNQLRLKAITELPIDDDTTGDNTKKLYANCRIISVQRLSQDEYMLSLGFVDFENGSEKILDDFLDQYVQKKTIIRATA